ncbi:DR2241 family protein [Haloparvum alkalitolerans]|uniref:DR2241 family protein n=1 Tax=Haloparvum alkalitolerans TaxID=1042953 RepID=UPI003CEF84DD
MADRAPAAAPADPPDVTLGGAAFDALVRALDAGESVDHGGFTARPADADGDGYRVEAADGERHEGLSESGLHELASAHATAVTDWHFLTERVGEGGPRASFVRWLEGVDVHGVDAEGVAARYAALADGAAREWGQLLVSVRLGDRGDRVYEVRHADEAGADAADLDGYDDPLEARRLVKFDDDDRYRPLKTAPTLPTGWVFAALDHRSVYETVETVYPATVANWHREREGELDVNHWRETMERQSGIYGVIRTWDRGEGHEHVNWVAEATCDDSQCLKRREWEYDEETDLDVDGGDGVFPCREPCSLVVSAARKWTKLEGETERTYEFELTPSEKEQVEAIIDAVADDRTDEIREADVYEGANRYRTRFLRAKRFDEAGNLCGVPTDADEE